MAEVLILPHPDAAPNRAINLDNPRQMNARLKEPLARFDVVGISLGIPGLLLLSYALSSGQDKGWGSTQIVTWLLISVFMLTLFVLHERVAPSPLLTPKLFRQSSFNFTLVLAVFTYAIRQAATLFPDDSIAGVR